MNQNEQYDAIVVGTEAAGFKVVTNFVKTTGPMQGIHEMGEARMGWNPRTSGVNLNKQPHDVPNVYSTDGAFMTSASCVIPSLNYMAFTARDAKHAADQFKSGNIS